MGKKDGQVLVRHESTKHHHPLENGNPASLTLVRHSPIRHPPVVIPEIIQVDDQPVLVVIQHGLCQMTIVVRRL